MTHVYDTLYDTLMDGLAAWREQLERRLEHLDTLPSPMAYQFDPLQIPPLLHPAR
jgi:hypothetical protein